MRPGIDKKGVVVAPGDRVRLLAIRPLILARLSGPEHADVASMNGRVVEVFDVYDDGQVWVWLTWDRGGGKIESHSIAVDPEAIERVSGAGDET